jgi:predicted transcriptional regulator
MGKMTTLFSDFQAAVATVEWMDYKNYIGNCFYINDKWCDVCLISSEGATINCHYLILAAASDFFKKILTEEKPQVESLTKIIIPDINYKILKCIVGYIYTGEIALNTDELEIFLEGCNLLSIKGITDVENIIEDNVDPPPVVPEPVQITASVTSASTAAALEQPGPGLYNIQILETMETEELDQHSNNQIIEPIPTLEIEDDADQPMDEYELIKREIEHDNGDYDDANASADEDQAGDILPDLYHSSDDPLMEASGKKNDMFYVLDKTSDLDGSKTEDDDQMPGTSMSVKDDEDKKRKERKDYPNLKQAIEMIVEQGMSYANASKQFDVPKYVLFRQVRKMNVSRYYKFDAIKDVVHKEMENGETLTSISQKYNIPISTLHRYKVKLSNTGVLSNSLTPKTQRRKDEKVKLIKTIEELMLAGLSQTEIAKKMDIPKTTLWRLIKNGENRKAKSGDSSVVHVVTSNATSTTSTPMNVKNEISYYVVATSNADDDASSLAEGTQMLAQILKSDNC